MNFTLPQNWPLPDEYMLEIGRLSANFSVMESGVNIAIGKLMGYEGVHDWRAAVVVAHLNFKQRVDMLETLCHELHDEFPALADYAKVMSDIKKAQNGRNRFLHQSLLYDKKSGTVSSVSLSARGQMKPRIDAVSLQDIQRVSAESHLATLSLHQLITGSKYAPIWERQNKEVDSGQNAT